METFTNLHFVQKDADGRSTRTVASISLEGLINLPKGHQIKIAVLPSSFVSAYQTDPTLIAISKHYTELKELKGEWEIFSDPADRLIIDEIPRSFQRDYTLRQVGRQYDIDVNKL